MNMALDAHAVRDFLHCATPAAWLDSACEPENLPDLLIDHANCEKKAAATALNLMYRYVDSYPLLHRLSRLAREELRHFEQVITLMEGRGIAYRQLSAAHYASRLRSQVRSAEPQRLFDTLLVGAIIEARSCERFAALAPRLDAELGDFYRSLLKSESRHFRDYLDLSAGLATEAEVTQRVQALLAEEATLINEPAPELRFHSGPPVL